MVELSASELRGQLLRVVALIGDVAASQEAWLRLHDLPVSELFVELDLVWPLWRARLVGEGAIDANGERALDDLRQTFEGIVDDDHAHLFTPLALETEPEWDAVRRKARATLAVLDKLDN